MAVAIPRGLLFLNEAAIREWFWHFGDRRQHPKSLEYIRHRSYVRMCRHGMLTRVLLGPLLAHERARFRERALLAEQSYKDATAEIACDLYQRMRGARGRRVRHRVEVKRCRSSRRTRRTARRTTRSTADPDPEGETAPGPRNACGWLGRIAACIVVGLLACQLDVKKDSPLAGAVTDSMEVQPMQEQDQPDSIWGEGWLARWGIEIETASFAELTRMETERIEFQTTLREALELAELVRNELVRNVKVDNTLGALDRNNLPVSMIMYVLDLVNPGVSATLWRSASRFDEGDATWISKSKVIGGRHTATAAAARIRAKTRGRCMAPRRPPSRVRASHRRVVRAATRRAAKATADPDGPPGRRTPSAIGGVS